MAVTAQVYGQGALNVLTGSIDLNTDTFKLMLATNAYTPDIDTHDFRNDVTPEVTGTGYTTGGVTLTTVTATYDSANNRVKFDADDVSWTTSTITARYAVIYKSRGGASSADELLLYIDFGADVVSTGGTFAITFDSLGIMLATV
jgi:hypothetical protein